MIEQLLEQAKHQWLNIGAFAFLLILIPIRSWTRNLAFKKIEKTFSDDEIILVEPKIPFIVDFFVPSLFGGSALELILSHEDLPIILFIRILIVLALLFCVFLSVCTKYEITNKRVFCVPSFDFMYTFKKFLGINFFELNLSDINSVKIKAPAMGYNGLEFENKNGEKSIRLIFDNMDEIKSKIDDLILFNKY